MPASEEMPSTIERSPEHAQAIWAKAHDSAVESYGEGERAHRTAFAALKHEYEKVGDHWEKKEHSGPSDDSSAGGEALDDNVAVGEHALQPAVFTADRQRPDIEVAQQPCGVHKGVVLTHALRVGGHHVTSERHGSHRPVLVVVVICCTSERGRFEQYRVAASMHASRESMCCTARVGSQSISKSSPDCST
jgi:cation transport regulator ChaB